MEKIDKYQLISMTILFMIGSTPLYELGIGVKQDAWIVMVAGLLAGLLLLALYLYIQRNHAGMDFFQILNTHLGKLVGTVLSVCYVVYFAYESMRNTREFGDIINISFLPNTPLSLLMLVMVLLSGYAISKGVEVFFRVAEFMFPFTIFGYAALFCLIIGSNIIHLDRLLPVMEHGLLPILEQAIPEVISFPFGQIVVFLMFWSHLNEKRKMVRVSVYSYLFVGVLLLLFNVLNLAILDPSITFITTFPLLRSVRLIQIANFLERLDPVIILLIYIGIFVKMTAFYLGAVLGLAHLVRISRFKLTVVVGAAIYGMSFLAPNFIYHVWIGFAQNLKYHFPVFQICIPALLAAIIFCKSWNDKKKKRAKQPS